MADVGTDAGKLIGGLGLDRQEETENLLLGGPHSRDVGENRDLANVSIVFRADINFLTVLRTSFCQVQKCLQFPTYKLFVHSENVLNPWLLSPAMVTGREADASALGRPATAAADTIKKTREFFGSK